MLKSSLIPLALAGLLATGLASASRADFPEILKATAERSGMGWRIEVTLQHPDTGWDHYADGWDVQDAHGQKIGFRELMHPHVDEQPFTRSLVNVMPPDGTREVFIRARCSVAGWSGELFRLKLEN